ncbi:beta-1,4-xylosyltransferase IRX9-like [Macadamia integrifolia]|uniref:beta-1,4-xylosyltransferase IRX9-like n=1 Tax=Macadamia integrifolia TaxID=60698 RepID=UPI001C4E65FD|nr:beta-1,4-xylosyltransferase IRX9-like [Macadamia integrifolia]
MGSFDRSKKRVQLWKKAAFHIVFCFIMGFFTGFTPTSRASIFSGPIESNQSMKNQEFSPPAIEIVQPVATREVTLNRNLMAKAQLVVPETLVAVQINSSGDQKRKSAVEEEEEEEEDVTLIPKKVLIVITPTRSNDLLQGALLRRMATTLKLVPPPLLWMVVEAESNSTEISEILRCTGVMYRHLVFKEKFTDPEAEMDHQRNIALNLIEYHRLDGIIHFAGLSNFYDLDFFEEIRETEVFGAWPIASVAANRKRVVIEGPVCDSSQVIGWQLWGMNNHDQNLVKPIHVSSFAFNSSILWDPERWGRPSSVQDASQNTMKYVQQVVLEDESKLKGIPKGDCSKIMLWNVHIPRQIMTYHSSSVAPPNSKHRW